MDIFGINRSLNLGFIVCRGKSINQDVVNLVQYQEYGNLPLNKAKVLPVVFADHYVLCFNFYIWSVFPGLEARNICIKSFLCSRLSGL